MLLEIYATGNRGGARASGPSPIVAAGHVAALPAGQGGNGLAGHWQCAELAFRLPA